MCFVFVWGLFCWVGLCGCRCLCGRLCAFFFGLTAGLWGFVSVGLLLAVLLLGVFVCVFLGVGWVGGFLGRGLAFWGRFGAFWGW